MPRQQVSASAIRETIRAIREFHDLGKKSRHTWMGPVPYGDGMMARHSRLLGGGSEDRVRKARQFADPMAGYSDSRLNELLALLREHRPDFGTSHVLQLLTVSWDNGREELQRRCITENWSTSALASQIRLRFAPRSHGGRRRIIPNQQVALVQLDEMARAWQKWHEAAKEDVDGAGTILSGLPPIIRWEVESLHKAVKILGNHVAKQLVKIRSR